MLRLARSFLASTLVLSAAASSACAQSVPPSGTLQLPTSPAHEQPRKPPSAAPREPVHVVGKTPVIPAQGPVHPRKPASGVSGKPAPAQPVTPPAAPVPPQVETKTDAPEKPPDPEKSDGTVAKLPRFASLRSDDVNMRAGPGSRYRIDWVYKRRELPVEIEREFDVWRWVRDADGVQGWVHQATLMGRRSFIIQTADATVRSDASDTATAVVVLKPGVIGRIRSCEAASDWCSVQAGSYRGYLHREQFWGVLPNEVVTP